VCRRRADFIFAQGKNTCRVELLIAAFLVSLLIAACATTAPAMREFKGTLYPGQKLVRVATRPGVAVRVLLATPKTDPRGIFVLFPGGDGDLISESGYLPREFGRSSFYLFVEHGFVAAVVDVPSDQHDYGVTDGFRISKEHAEDAGKVIDFLTQRSPKPVFLLGHSRGTQSVAYLAKVLKAQRIGGIVLAAATTNPRSPFSLDKLPLQDITYPVLFVHHREDSCNDFQGAVQQQSRLIKSSKVGFIEVVGGGPFLTGDPCSGRGTPHGFAGKEREVVNAITDWVLGKPTSDRAEKGGRKRGRESFRGYGQIHVGDQVALVD